MSHLNVGSLKVTGSIKIPVYTEAQRDSMATPRLGMLIFNSTSAKVEIYNGGDWSIAGEEGGGGGANAGGGLFAFTSFTFTNGGATLNSGPTKSALLSSYNVSSNPWLNQTEYYDVTSTGIQMFTVPKDGTYQIQAYGAVGGQGYSGCIGGNGAVMTGSFTLTKNQKLWICVGQIGGTWVNQYNAGGGGGASYVSVGDSLSTSSALIVAGGGGGGGTTTYFGYSPGYGAPTTNNGDTPGTYYGNSYAQPGASFSFNSSGYAGTFPLGFKNGATGGSGLYNCRGGFGGGGDTYHSGAGGGGYSGGATGIYYYSTPNGGGGGSINNGTNQSNTGSSNNGVGRVVITLQE